MKYIKPRYYFILILNPLVVLSSAFFYFVYPAIAMNCFYASWISTIAAILLLFSRSGNHHLAQQADDIATRLPLKQWLLCIFTLEIMVFGVYLGICFVCGNAFPINMSQQPHLFAGTLRTELCHFGLFPWPLYAVIAASMGVLAYRQETNAYFSHLLKPLIHDEPGERFALIVNIAARRCTLFAMAILLTFMTFLMMSLVLTPDIQLVDGFQMPALLTTLILLFFTYTKIAKRYIAKILSRRIPTGIAFPLFCLALCFIILFVNVMTAGIIQQKIMPANIPPFITRWIHMNWETSWRIFSAMFWICLTPLICNCIVRLSKGYRIREMIIAVLILPLIISLILYFHLDMTLTPRATTILSLMSFLILLPLLLNHGNSGSAIFSYYPKHGIIKHHDEKPFFEKIVQLTIVAIYFYLVIGVNGLGVFVFAPLFVFFPMLMVMMIMRNTR